MLPQYNLILNIYICHNPISKKRQNKQTNKKHNMVRHCGSELQNKEFKKIKIQLIMKIFYLVLNNFLL